MKGSQNGMDPDTVDWIFQVDPDDNDPTPQVVHFNYYDFDPHSQVLHKSQYFNDFACTVSNKMPFHTHISPNQDVQENQIFVLIGTYLDSAGQKGVGAYMFQYHSKERSRDTSKTVR